jgi:lactoylglutathione lyase
MLIGHIGLWTKDIEGMKAFYTKYFDAVSNAGYENPAKGFRSYFLAFETGAMLELMALREPLVEQDTRRYGLAHLAFTVPSRAHVEILTDKLMADGYHCSSLPRVTGDGYFESVIIDPEGNAIEIVADI